jgi:hypothetical protein
MYSYGYG